MDRPRDLRMPQSTFSQQQNDTIRLFSIELQQFQYHSMAELSRRIKPDFVPNTCLNIPTGPRMPQSMFSQQENALIQPSCPELQQFHHHSLAGLLPPIEPDCVPKAYLDEFRQLSQVDWSYPKFEGEDTPGLYNIFVGDFGDEVTDDMLFSFFYPYETCVGSRVMRDKITDRSRGFGYVAFRTQEDAQSAINDSNGKLLGSSRIRCHWPTEGAGAHLNKHSLFLNRSIEDGKEMPSSEAPKNDPPQYTNVYVSNLSPEARNSFSSSVVFRT